MRLHLLEQAHRLLVAASTPASLDQGPVYLLADAQLQVLHAPEDAHGHVRQLPRLRPCLRVLDTCPPSLSPSRRIGATAGIAAGVLAGRRSERSSGGG